MKVNCPNEPGCEFYLRKVRYKEILRIDEVEIPHGKVTCIVGPSGTGKTTLLKMLNRMVTPDEGEVFYRGKDIKEIDSVELRRRVVMLPQIPVVFEGDLRENLVIGCRFAEKPLPGDDALKEALAMVKLDKEFPADTAKMSGGEKQRLALARVLLTNPETLLLDEPSASLDQETERLVFDTVTGYARAKEKTLIMVSHSPKMSENYADLIIKVAGGGIDRKGVVFHG